jgi:hypothetical protein
VSREWTPLANQRGEFPSDVIHAALAESDTYFPDMTKIASIEHPEDQASELSAVSPRFGKAGYHRIKMEMSPYLEPG